MPSLKQTTIALAAVAAFTGTATLATSETNAAGLVMPNATAIQASLTSNTNSSVGNGEAKVIKVGVKRKRLRKAIRKGIRHHGHSGGIHFHVTSSYHNCIWKKKRYWDAYHGHYYTKRVNVCYRSDPNRQSKKGLQSQVLFSLK